MGELVWSEPRGLGPFSPFRQFAIVRRNHRIIHQQAQCNDQRGDGDLLDAEQLHHAQGHSHRNGDRQRHDQGAAPFHEQQTANDHDQHGFQEVLIALDDLRMDLFRLVARPLDTQVLRQFVLEFLVPLIWRMASVVVQLVSRGASCAAMPEPMAL